MAVSERMLAATFNRPGHDVINHYTYVIASDGDLMEGISHEAASLAGHLALGKLLCLWDDNEITIDGSTSLSVSEDVEARFRAYGWHVVAVADGNDSEEVDAALAASMAEAARPSLVRVPTTIGYGSPGKAGSERVHGSPLGEQELRAAKRNLGWPEERPFYVPDEVRTAMCAAKQGGHMQKDWNACLARYGDAYPELAAELAARLRGSLPARWEETLPGI